MEERFETFTVLINRLSRNIRKIKNLEMADYQLRSVHISCLYYLYSADGLTATELCERCEEDKATISRALEYLEHNGYLICSSRNLKRYKSALHLTEKGFEIAQKIKDRVDGVLQTISKELTEEERIVFYRNLTAISNSLETIAKTIEKNAGGYHENTDYRRFNS